MTNPPVTPAIKQIIPMIIVSTIFVYKKRALTISVINGEGECVIMLDILLIFFIKELPYIVCQF